MEPGKELSAYQFFKLERQMKKENSKKVKRKKNKGNDVSSPPKKVKLESVSTKEEVKPQKLPKKKLTQTKSTSVPETSGKPKVVANSSKVNCKEPSNGLRIKNITKKDDKIKKKIKIVKTSQVNGKVPAKTLVSPSEKSTVKKKKALPPTDDTEEIPQLVEIPAKSRDKKKSKTKLDALNGKSAAIKVPAFISESEEEDEEDEEVAGFPVVEETVPNGLSLFKWLLNPVKTEHFFNKYWERECLLIERNQSSYYKHIFSSQSLDTILRENPLFYTRNIDVVAYENGVKESYNQEGRASAASLWDYYANGCSIRLLNPQTYHKQVHLLLSTLQEYFGTMVGSNVYLTPPGTQGFAPHYDDIEAFIVQLEGRKHWKLYRPKGKDVLARDSSPNLKAEDLGEPFMEVTLNAGDLLYFPRGTIHEGRTDSEQHSLHITISVYQHTAYADLLGHILPAALKKAAESDIAYRKGLPLQFLRHVGQVHEDQKSKTKTEIANKVKDLIRNLINHIDVDVAADLLGKKFMHDCMPPILMQNEVDRTSKGDGDFMKNGKVYNRVEIGLDSKIRLLRYHCLHLSVQESTAKIYYCTDNAKVYHGEEEQWLEIDPVLIPAIKVLQTSYPNYVEVDSLPVDDEIMKVQLVSDLWEKGLLVTEEPLAVFEDETESELSEDESKLQN